jgi:hypothetical protein
MMPFIRAKQVLAESGDSKQFAGLARMPDETSVTV